MNVIRRIPPLVRRLLNGTRAGDTAGDGLMAECPRCGRCEDAAVRTCPADGSGMKASATVPYFVDARYRLERLLARGGMGAVYQAMDVRLGRAAAVKVIRADLVRDPTARARFEQEAQILARLEHPSIVDIFDYGTLADGSPYLAMELVHGEDLRRELNREGRLDPARARRILSAVCGAMEAAHRAGVLHCDLKPENILLPEEGVEAKVLDFGVARAIGAELARTAPPGPVVTVEARIVGTPAYMAPEQLRGETPDPRTDVFSLGVIAYEMLTGDVPFGGGSIAEVALAQTRGMLPAGLEAIPAPLSRAVRSALALDADRRPPSPQAFGYLIAAAGGL